MMKFLFPDLKKRSDEVELMDLPDCDEKKLINTIEQFKFLNYIFTRSRYLIIKYFINEMKKAPHDTYSFLDIGAGGCDIPYWFLKKCRKYGFNIKIVCLDNDLRIVKYVKNKFGSVKNLKIIKGSAFEIEKLEKFDFIFTNHFLHHLPSEDIPYMINLISKQTKKIFLINDLYRSLLFLFQHSVFSKLFLHNSFVYYDGKISIKKGFNEKEMNDFIRETSNINFLFKIERKFPSRICLIGNKKT